jgi:hypothetical protein
LLLLRKLFRVHCSIRMRKTVEILNNATRSMRCCSFDEHIGCTNHNIGWRIGKLNRRIYECADCGYRQSWIVHFIILPLRIKYIDLNTFYWKAVSYLTAKYGGRSTKLMIRQRLMICRVCPVLKQKENGAMFCMNCGCGERPAAELHRKVTYRRADCPRNKWIE